MTTRASAGRVLRQRIAEAERAPPRPAIGAAVRDRRRRLGLTLREAAEAAGVSVPFLSQIERGLAAPSLVSLLGIASALGVDIHYFIDVPKAGQVVRRARTPEVLDAGLPVAYHRLSGAHDERKLEALLMVVPPDAAAPPARREGEGFWYVLAGRLRMTVGEETFVLDAGDSAHFDQRHAYRMENAGRGALRLLWVGTPALF